MLRGSDDSGEEFTDEVNLIKYARQGLVKLEPISCPRSIGLARLRTGFVSRLL